EIGSKIFVKFPCQMFLMHRAFTDIFTRWGKCAQKFAMKFCIYGFGGKYFSISRWKEPAARIAWRATPMLVFEQCQQAKGGDPMSSGNSELSIRSGLGTTALEQPLAFA
ncbi:MAG: hypothetical protein MI753_04900, partial [Hyphomicrobiales bacterium]|nr:hypothetical protein [Hyphomicrobiales bacterium]